MKKDDRLAHLLTYTTFHIGVYISLATALIGAGVLDDDLGKSLFLRYTVGCICLAGVCGGIVGSNIPEHRNFKTYARVKIGYLSIKPFRYRCWVFLEHFLFWIGILPLAVAFVCCGPGGIK